MHAGNVHRQRLTRGALRLVGDGARHTRVIEGQQQVRLTGVALPARGKRWGSRSHVSATYQQ